MSELHLLPQLGRTGTGQSPCSKVPSRFGNNKGLTANARPGHTRTARVAMKHGMYSVNFHSGPPSS
jgi:hypothetical protein